MSDKELPPGFEYVFDEGFYGGRRRVLVPYSVKRLLDAEAALKAFEEAVKDVEAKEMANSDNESPSVFGLAKSKLEEARGNNKSDPAAQWLEIGVKDLRESYATRKDQIPVFKVEDVLKLNKQPGHDEDAKRLQAIHDELLERGTTMRKVCRPPNLGALKQLAVRQPHMAPVIDFVASQLRMAERSSEPVRLQPMLLLGEPGIGKTHFAQLLARTLGAQFRIERLDSDLTNSFLLGSDRKWGNSQHGALFEMLARGGQSANPVIVLDELDKAQRTSYGSASSTLYSVLEPVSAKSVRDISLDITLDASLVTWIATANDARLIDAPLRSRFREFHIMPPTASQALTLAECVVEDTIIDSGVTSMEFDRRVIPLVAHLTARQIYQLTLDGVAKAVSEGRSRLEKRDLPAWLLDDSSEEPTRNRLH